ncbi:MAG: putative DNA binding domain-containing protein [Prevotella sp.]|jgi:ATP-dependent DNA helicase RecG|nr:putative DNA binding domain-containing protein [Prevotella sp.]
MDDYSKLLEQLISRVEGEVIEYKAASSQYDKKKLGEYFSALSNEANLRDIEFAWMILGVNNDRQVSGTKFLLDEVSRNLLKHEIAMNMTEGMTFRDIIPLNFDGKRVLMFKIPAGPRNIVVKWKGIAYGRDGESLVPLSQDKIDTIRFQRPLDDWSAHIVENTTIEDDLDELALAKARIMYKKVHDNTPSDIIDLWSSDEFLTYSGVLQEGKLTRAALLLLGKESSAYKLRPAIAQITWTLINEEGRKMDYQHFTIPYIIKVDEILGKIRNLTMREMPMGTLFPDKIMQYDNFVIREAMHNAIAHQDYTLCQRINFIEAPDYLHYSNAGDFYPGTIEQALEPLNQQKFYRNECLCQGMRNFNMIDTVSSGIQTMFYKQKERNFPLPDYDINETKPEVNVTIYGKVIDNKYVELLKHDSSISLKECIWLDAIQKRKYNRVSEEAIKILKSNKLIEGRKSNYIISLAVARKTDQVHEYTKQKGLATVRYENMIIGFLSNMGSQGVMRNDIIKFLEDSLPASKNSEAKKKFVTNILSKLRRNNIISRIGRKWIIKPQ